MQAQFCARPVQKRQQHMHYLPALRIWCLIPQYKCWVLTKQYVEVLDLVVLRSVPDAGNAVLRRVVQHLLQIFEAQVPARAAERQPPRRQISNSDPDMPASPGWQGRAASAVVALAEIMFGASALWQGMQQQQQQQQGEASTCSQHSQLNSSLTATTATTSTTTAGDLMTAHVSTDGKKSPHRPPSSDLADAAVHTDSNLLEALVVQALDDFSSAGAWSLATHLDPDAAGPGQTPLTPQVRCVSIFTLCMSSCRCFCLGAMRAHHLLGL